MGLELTPETIFMNDHILFRASVTVNNLAGAYIDEPLVGNLINQLITHIILDPKKEILKKNCSNKKFECPLPRSTLRAPATVSEACWIGPVGHCCNFQGCWIRSRIFGLNQKPEMDPSNKVCNYRAHQTSIGPRRIYHICLIFNSCFSMFLETGLRESTLSSVKFFRGFLYVALTIHVNHRNFASSICFMFFLQKI